MSDTIQTSNLESSFQALRNNKPENIAKQDVPFHPDYKRIPYRNYAPIATSNTQMGNGNARFAGNGIVYGQPQFFSPVHTPINWQIPSKRLEEYQWARFFYSNEPKVAAALDFYSDFPMSDWTHECKNIKVKNYFDRFKKRLHLSKWMRLISHEVHLLGDCFPLVELDCPLCGGSGRIGDEICDHEGGTIGRIIILNPDFIEVITSPLSQHPIIALKPDEEMINMVRKKLPGYERLSPQVLKLISAGQSIRLDNNNVAHLKYGESPYRAFGIGMVRRLFPVLSYKTKLMVAQWVVAERLIIPIKIVKVGSDERPAGPADIAAVQEQLANTANDPNLTIVTHNNFELDFYGACHSADTEVLTENGWKLYLDVSKNFDEKIATYNLGTDSLEFDIPQQYHEYDFNGEMVSFQKEKVDVLVTPNHRMLISDGGKYRLEHAENLEKKSDVLFKIPNCELFNDSNDKSISKDCEVTVIQKDNISRVPYNGKVWCFTVKNGFFVTRRNGKIGIHGNSGKVLTLSNEFDFINQEILDGLMINNALLNGEGPNFCLSADTKLLTNNGLKTIDTFDMEKDMVATFNKNNDALEYQKAIRRYSYDHNSVNGKDKPLKRFLTNRIDMLVTDNHKMLCADRKLTTVKGMGGQKVNGQKEGFGEWNIIEASQVKNRCMFRSCIDKWVGVTEDKGEYCGIKTDDFLRILGWYVSEGWRCVDKNRGGKVYRVGIAQSPTANPEVHANIKEVLLKYNIHNMSDSEFFITNTTNRELTQFLSDNVGLGSNTKHIPSDFKNMSCDKLKILLGALVDGDGNERPATKKKETNKQYYSYTTVSTQLRDDVIEILFKLGFSPRFATIKFDEPQLQTQYTINWSDNDAIGRFPKLASRDMKVKPQKTKQVIFDEPYEGKVWCVEVPNHFIITERNGLFGIHGNSSAAVGIEAMIQRLETFRSKMSEWMIEFIYTPEAKRQGFIDKDSDSDDEEYIVPNIKWDKMHLRDQQQDKTFAMQLYEKGLLSAQTMLETFGYDPDMEIERKRYDYVQMMALGQGFGGQQQGGAGGGGGGGGMPDMGGGGGMPDMGGGGGGDAGGLGAPPIEAGGGAPAAPTGGAPVAAKTNYLQVKTAQMAQPVQESPRFQPTKPQIADPGQFGGRVLREKTREKVMRDQSRSNSKQKQLDDKNVIQKGPSTDEQGRITFTKPERQLIELITKSQQEGLLKYNVIPQYAVNLGGPQPYSLDFAIVKLKIGVEADGEVFHSNPNQIQRDKERDMNLTQAGWTIVRFKDSEIEKKGQQVMATILKNVMQKELLLKKFLGGDGQEKGKS